MATRPLAQVKGRALATSDPLVELTMATAPHAPWAELIEVHLDLRGRGGDLINGAALIAPDGECIAAHGSLQRLRPESWRALPACFQEDAPAAVGFNDRHYTIVRREVDFVMGVSGARKALPLESIARSTLMVQHLSHSFLIVVHSAPLGGRDAQEAFARTLHLGDILRGGGASSLVPMAVREAH